MSGEGPTTVGSIDAKLGIDKSEWDRKATEVKAEAKELGALSPDIKVDADVAGALAKMKAVSAEATAMRQKELIERGRASNAAIDEIVSRKRVAAAAKYESDQIKWNATLLAKEAAARAAANAVTAEGTAVTDRDTASTNRNVDSNNRRVRGYQVLIGLAPAILAAAAPIGAAAIGLGVAFGVMAGAGVAAVMGIKHEMELGTAVGEQYSTGLGVLKTDMAALGQTSAVVMLGSFKSMVDEINSNMPFLNQLIATGSAQLGQMGNTALTGVINGLRVMNPLIQAGGVELNQFVSWLAQMTTSNGFSSFVQYAISNLPPVMAMIESLVTLAGNLLAAFAPLGPVIIAVITGISDALNALPLPVLAGLASAAFLIGPAFAVARTAVSLFGVASATAAGEVTLFGMAANLAIPVVGIITALLAGLTIGVTAAALSHQNATVAVNTYTQALKDDNDAIGTNVRATAAKALQDAGAYDAALKLGISQKLLTDDVLGVAGAHEQLAAKVDAAQAKIDGAAKSTYNYNSATGAGANSANGFTDAIKTVTGAVSSNNQQIQDGITAGKNMAAGLDQTTTSVGYQASAAQQLAAQHGINATAYQAGEAAQKTLQDQLDKTTGSLYAENDAAGLLKQAWERMNGKSMEAAGANIAFDSSLATMGDHITATGKKITFTTTSITDQSVASIDLRRQMFGQVQAMEKVVEANGGLQAASGKGREEYDKLRTRILDNAEAHGVERDAAQQMIDTWFKMPEKVVTKAEALTDDAMAKMKALRDFISTIRGVSITNHIDSVYSDTHVSDGVGGSGGQTKSDGGAVYRADGGPVYLAGGGFSRGPIGTDTVPAWLTPGEHVMKRASAESIGAPALKYMNDTGKLPPGAGGMVTVNFMLDGQIIDSRIINLSTMTTNSVLQSAAHDNRNRRA